VTRRGIGPLPDGAEFLSPTGVGSVPDGAEFLFPASTMTANDEVVKDHQ
jgi:hypothetical protein